MGNTVSSVPYGAHSSHFNTLLSCSLAGDQGPGGGPATPFLIPFETSVTAPLASDTEIYFTDIYSKNGLPNFEYTLIINTAVYYSTNVSPSTFVVNGSRLVEPNDHTVYSPTDGVATAGPFQMTNEFAHLKVLYMTLSAFNADELFNYNCTIPDNIVISVANSNLSSATTAPATGVRGSFPDTPIGSKSEIANLPVSCSDKAYNFTVQGTIPGLLPANTPFNLSNVDTFLTTDVGTETAFIAQYGKQNGADVPGIVAQFSNASPSDVDISRDFTPSDPETSNPLSGGRYTDGTAQSLTIAAPRLGSLSKYITAGSAGYVTALVKSFAGTFYTTDGSSTFSCTAKYSSALLTAIIE